MFKRITAFVAVLFMGLVITVRAPVKADTFSIPFSAVPDLINAFYTVASGGKIEFSALIGEFTGYNEFVQNLHDYYDTHYTAPLIQSTQGFIDMGLSSLALSGVDSITQVNGLTVPVSPQDLANFMGYSTTWADRYNDVVDNIEVNPDVNYIAYLNTINLKDSSNSSAFWFYDVGNVQVIVDTYTLLRYPVYNYSWYNNVNIQNNFNLNGYYDCLPISDLHIYSNNDTYTCNFNAYSLNNVVDRNNGQFTYSRCGFKKENGNIMFVQTQPQNISNAVSFSSTGTLSHVFNDICLHFKNVNIYVDDQLWSYVGNVPTPAITINDPTAVGNTGDITYGVYPFTATGDVGLDLAKWGEYLYEKATSGTNVLTMDTVIDDGWDLVDTSDGERSITQDDEEDVVKVIHGFVENTATTPTPTPDIGDPPILKIIPPILELPDEIWPDGGRDTTVLAQMVHATDVAIPNDIMTVIWSTIGLLVVGGLISILHK